MALLVSASLATLVLMETTGATDYFLDCKWTETSTSTRKICKDYDRIPSNGGCEAFSIGTGSGWDQPGAVLPQCPKELDIQFKQYHSDTTRTFYDDLDLIEFANYSNVKKVIIVTGGFLNDECTNSLVTKMKTDILQKEKDTVVVVTDWPDGANVEDYKNKLHHNQAIANTRTVGAAIAQFIHLLKHNHKIPYSDVHLIGFGLGAHASGFAGKEIFRTTAKTESTRHIGRITGLDPYGGHFDKVSSETRLSEGDAYFVDIYHTNAIGINESPRGYGITKDIGDVDFWINGGMKQPNHTYTECKDVVKRSDKPGKVKRLYGNLRHHIMALIFFVKSVLGCKNEVGGNCKMGYHAKKWYCDGRNAVRTLPKGCSV